MCYVFSFSLSLRALYTNKSAWQTHTRMVAATKIPYDQSVLLNNARVTYCLRSTISSSYFNFFPSLIFRERERKQNIYSRFFRWKERKKNFKNRRRNERNWYFLFVAVAGMIFDIRFISSSSLFSTSNAFYPSSPTIFDPISYFSNSPSRRWTQKFYDVVYRKLFSAFSSIMWGKCEDGGISGRGLQRKVTVFWDERTWLLVIQDFLKLLKDEKNFNTLSVFYQNWNRLNK